MPRAAANRRDAAQIAVGVHSADAVAGIHALLIETGRPVGRALRVGGAFRPTRDVRISHPRLKRNRLYDIRRASAFVARVDSYVRELSLRAFPLMRVCIRENAKQKKNRTLSSTRNRAEGIKRRAWAAPCLTFGQVHLAW